MSKNTLLNQEWNTPEHCMLDIETLGVGKNAVLTSISAVQFNPYTGETLAEFDIFLDIQSQIDLGFDLNADTILFWMKQPNKQRMELVNKCKDGVHITHAIQTFSAWVKQNGIKYLYGKGSSFDNALLQNAYDRTKLKTPTSFRDDRCVRTLIALAPKSKSLDFTGDLHKGLDDSKHQIKQVSYVLQQLFKEEKINYTTTTDGSGHSVEIITDSTSTTIED
ncbi:exonuclease [Tenacibaculum phage PTm1]|uniref:Exonuclease n=2 Tax=Shirahamavirus PTm1 TaxID=2846435 RepID=A0A5S9EQQ4_9CAUD|nr:exonuclease [Tenacibaculum phage PTm1]BBI90663.1 exonuclease [Tenacibaculum phage PTm1]BBI90968.1 exonuclease [Tenacibaculum phage PTm5]